MLSAPCNREESLKEWPRRVDISQKRGDASVYTDCVTTVTQFVYCKRAFHRCQAWRRKMLLGHCKKLQAGYTLQSTDQVKHRGKRKKRSSVESQKSA